MAIVAPSVLAADFLNLEREISMVNQSAAEWVHLDVMDGAFVPNISFGMPVIKAIRSGTKKFIDVHLMIQDPDRYLNTFHELGADLISVHYEASPHLHRTLGAISELGIKNGVALNPHTPVSVLDEVLSMTDLVVLMSVNPGFGGQKFIENTYNKVSQLKDKIIQSNANTLIEIDGGVGLENHVQLKKAGADVLVAGSAVFGSENPIHVIEELAK